jgi:hypothetical protein
MATILEQYRISDFLEWYNEKKLILNPDFQRGSVWTPAARSYLIDTILRQLPIPKIYLRTKVDTTTQRSVREVVDGQQRLRAIIDFANDRFALSKRAGEFAGLRYSTLDPDHQEVFISYPIAVGQLLNATDDDVLEVFSRLNSYTVSLNPAEKRHAQFQGEFKWAVRNASRKWHVLWDKYKIVTVRQRVRMQDDSLMAELFGVMLEGVTDGGQPKITGLYQKYDRKFKPDDPVIGHVNKVLDFIVSNLADDLIDTPILNAPHFLMFFAAVALALFDIPEGAMGNKMPKRNKAALSDLEDARTRLMELAAVIDSDEPVPGYEDFWRASKGSTQRIASRRIRFPVFYKALIP